MRAIYREEKNILEEQSEMKEPNRLDHISEFTGGVSKSFSWEMEKYNEQKALCKTYSVSGSVPEDWKTGRDLIHDVDYELNQVIEKNIIGLPVQYKIVAIPIVENKPKNMKTGIELIAEERQEQIEKHGFDVTNDQYYSKGELLQAAAFCLYPKIYKWPEGWDEYFRDKILNKSRVDQLKCAGAFAAAEIDRIQSDWEM